MWAGLDGQRFYMHGVCVIDWMPRVMRDAPELKYEGHPQQFKAALR
jgi:hypothetical protein